MIDLSIIIPTFNDAHLLIDGIESLFRQTLPKETFEIIVVDDCSTVGVHLLNDICNLHPQVQLIRHKENKHQGGARNTALRHAKGKYVVFVDADDRIVYNNTFEILISLMEEYSADVIRSYKATSSLLNTSEMYQCSVAVTITTGKDFIVSNPSFGCQIWNGIYRRSFLDTILPFVEHHFFEDTRWTTEMLYQCNQLGLIDFSFYHYSNNSESVTRTSCPQLLYDNYLAIVETKDFLQKCDDNQASRVIAQRVSNAAINLVNSSRNYDYSICKVVYKMCKENNLFNSMIYCGIPASKRLLLMVCSVSWCFHTYVLLVLILKRAKRLIKSLF